MSRRWLPDDPAALLAAYRSGVPAVAIAARYGVVPDTVRQFLLRHGLTPRPSGPRHGLCECGRMVRSTATPPWGCIRCSEDRAQHGPSAAR